LIEFGKYCKSSQPSLNKQVHIDHIGFWYNMKKGRCTRVENPGGILEVFAKIPRGGGSRVSGKIAWGGGSTYFGFYCIFINKFFENLSGGVCFVPPPPLPLPACIYGGNLKFSEALIRFEKSFWIWHFSLL
jgi:hypothetical protein